MVDDRASGRFARLDHDRAELARLEDELISLRLKIQRVKGRIEARTEELADELHGKAHSNYTIEIQSGPPPDSKNASAIKTKWKKPGAAPAFYSVFALLLKHYPDHVFEGYLLAETVKAEVLENAVRNVLSHYSKARPGDADRFISRINRGRFPTDRWVALTAEGAEYAKARKAVAEA